MKSRVPGHPSRYKYRRPGSPSWAYSKQNPHSLAPQPAPGPSHSATVEARTVFVWPRMGLRCGVAEFVNHLVAVADDGATCHYPGQVRGAEHVVLVLMPTLTPVSVADVQRLKSLGARVTLDVHHLTAGENPFRQLAAVADDAVWHHPRPPAMAGFGRYVPLPVPAIPRPDVTRLGGLTHFGLGTPHKRIDVMARVARELGTTLYCYGSNNQQFIPPGSSAVANDSYPSDLELARLLRQHDCALVGRAPWSGVEQINGAASPRFLIGAGVPTVVDQAVTHEDLVGAVEVVPFTDFDRLVDTVRHAVHDPYFRSHMLSRAEAYAEIASPRRVAEQMGVACRAP